MGNTIGYSKEGTGQPQKKRPTGVVVVSGRDLHANTSVSPRSSAFAVLLVDAIGPCIVLLCLRHCVSGVDMSRREEVVAQCRPDRIFLL